MSRGVNKVILIGNLGNNPDYRQMSSGVQVTRCSLATNRMWTNETGERQQRTEWHKVVFFNRLAEIASQYLKKGMQVYVEGYLRTNEWEKDNVKRYTTEVIAENMQMLGTRSYQDPPYEFSDSPAKADPHKPSDSSAEEPPQKQEKKEDKDKNRSYSDIDDDIPF